MRSRPVVTWVVGGAVLLGAVLTCAARPAARAAFDTRDGGIVRGPVDRRRIALEFTGHEFAEGAPAILEALARHRARASFFLTGDFLRRREFAATVRSLIAAGHYVGPHSDKHLLYCGWESTKPTLLSRELFRKDVEDNLLALEQAGVARAGVRYWVPAYEWYNAEVASWSEAMGLRLVNYTPGTRSNADYMTDADANFVSSQVIFDSALARERAGPDGLNGFLLLMHIGAGPGRRDKMHDRLGELMDRLTALGYQFVRVDELLGAGPPPAPILQRGPR